MSGRQSAPYSPAPDSYHVLIKPRLLTSEEPKSFQQALIQITAAFHHLPVGSSGPRTMGLLVLVISVASSTTWIRQRFLVVVSAHTPLKLFRLPRLRLRLLLPSIALIVAGTMVPTELRHPSLAYIDNTFTADDFVSNLVLYTPLGIALSGSSLIRAFLVGLSLSTCGEVLQLGYVDRVPSLFDIAANTCGAVVGYLAAMFWRRATGCNPVSLRVYRPLALAAIPVAIFGTMMLLLHRPRSDFSNWSSTFHLAVGNELTGDRPWAGTISEFAIYPFAMAQSQISDLISRRSGSYPSEPPTVSLVPTGSGRPLLSKPEELRLYDTLVRTNQFTLLVSMRTSNLEQIGPARIVTYSQDRTQRNFTLGQIRKSLTFRLRTPDSGPNGNNPGLISGPVLSLNRTFIVAAVYDGRFSKLYVDGKCVAQVDLGAKRPRLPGRISAWIPGLLPVRETELGGAQILFSALFSLGILALVGIPRRLSTRFFAGAIAGAAIGGTTWVFGVSQPSLGLRILLECVAAGLVILASVEADTAAPPAPGSSLLSRLDLHVKARLRQ